MEGGENLVKLGLVLETNKINKGETNMISRKALKSNKGFTLVELVIVIAILAILAVIVTQQVGGVIAKSKATADLTNASQIATAISRAYAESKIASTVTGGTGTSYCAMDDTTSGTSTNLSYVVKTNNYMEGFPKVKAGATGSFYANINTSTGLVTVKAVGGASTDTTLWPKPSTFSDTVYNVLN